MRKQKEVLNSPAHLLEIDLLRGGDYTLAVPDSLVRAHGPWDYLVCLHNADHPNDLSFWRNSLRQALPRVAVPLLNGYPDAIVALQTILETAYDNGAFDRLIDYSRDPVPPLSQDDAAWADAVLRDAGLRGA